MKVTVEVRGLAGLIAGLDQAPVLVGRELGAAVAATAQFTLDEIRSAAPGPRVAAEVHLDTQGDQEATTARIYLGGIAIPVATGAAPHEITPRYGKALRFPAGGFASHAAHPGTLPNDFFSRGADAAEPEAGRQLERLADDVLTAIARHIDRDG